VKTLTDPQETFGWAAGWI